jgi:hypothetical protein
MRWASGVLAVALLTSGCGSSTEDLARQAADRFESALESGQANEICALLTDNAARKLDCSTVNLPHATVREVHVWGDAAQARAGDDTLFLRELAVGWRISGAGCKRDSERPYQCEVGGP